MTKNVKKQLYRRYVNGLDLHQLTLWLHESGYKKITTKDKPAKVIELKTGAECVFPM